MPVTTAYPLHPISQSEFGKVAYEFMGLAFEVHRQLGRVFDESIYRRTLAYLLGDRCIQEFPIYLTHEGFEKSLFIDLVIDHSCPFELKATSSIHDRHRSQLIQYLMLSGLRHGKLVNFGGWAVKQEFVNCHESIAHQQSFQVEKLRWSKTHETLRFEAMLVGLLRDWGTGLDQSLYVQAVTHFLGGTSIVEQPIDTLWNGVVLGQQLVRLVASGTAFEITSFRDDPDSHEKHLVRFLAHTALDRIFWVNVASGVVQFVELRK